MLHTFEHLFFRCFVTLEFIGDKHPWLKALFFEEFAKDLLCCIGIPMPLQQDIQHVPFSIHRSLQIILLSFDRDDDFIQMPFVS